MLRIECSTWPDSLFDMIGFGVRLAPDYAETTRPSTTGPLSGCENWDLVPKSMRLQSRARAPGGIDMTLQRNCELSDKEPQVVGLCGTLFATNVGVEY